MPKVKITNTKGLVQETGGGVALFSATQTITANATAANAAILTTTSVALCDSANDAHKVQLPATAGLDAGYTVIVANIDAAQDFVLEKQASADRINAVNGALTLGQKTVAFCVYSGAADPGWIVTVGDQATVPA